MAITPGTYTLGPQTGELLVHTRRQGAASKAGHDLEMVVTDWSATLELGEASSLTLTANSSSLRVRAGRGGVKSLDEGDKDNIRQTIDDEVLKRTRIEFHSSQVEGTADGDHLRVYGELELMGETRPMEFDLEASDGNHLTGRATVKQTDFGMKPYSALFGALKVADEVEITVEASLQSR
ncbi:MAG TPA: YceI family protein [Solirubrobacteraceae bacterium]|nr:YceI family protein [Solirubrobacteraceae bacterium]